MLLNKVKKKERVICEFEVDFKKSFSWRSNLSNGDTISAYNRSESGYGFKRPGLKTYECGKCQFLGLK